VLAVTFVTIGWNETIPVAPDFRTLVRLERELLRR
jgi:hypothetical protein